MKTKILILSMAAVLPASWALAQNAGEPPRPPGPPRDGERRPGPRDGERPQGNGPRDGQRPPGPMPMPFLRVLDADEDGIISADEIKSAPDALKKLDKNGDGKLVREEWQPQPPRPPQGEGERPRGGEARTTEKKASDWPFGKKETATGEDAAGREKPSGDAQGKGERPPGPPAPPLLEVLDTDRDGTISEDEIGKSPESLAKLDQNKDGQLGPREYGPRPPQGPPPREGGRDGQKPAQ